MNFQNLIVLVPSNFLSKFETKYLMYGTGCQSARNRFFKS